MEVCIRLHMSQLKKNISTAENDQELMHGIVLQELRV